MHRWCCWFVFSLFDVRAWARTLTHTHTRSLRIWTTKQIRISFMTAWGVVCFTLEIIYDCIELCVNNVGWHVIRVNRLYIFFSPFLFIYLGFFCAQIFQSIFVWQLDCKTVKNVVLICLSPPKQFSNASFSYRNSKSEHCPRRQMIQCDQSQLIFIKIIAGASLAK